MMGWWNDLFGGVSEPRPRPVEVITKNVSKPAEVTENLIESKSRYLPLNENNIDSLISKYESFYQEHISKGDVLAYEGLTHNIIAHFSKYSSFRIEGCNTRIYLTPDRCTFEHTFGELKSVPELAEMFGSIPENLSHLTAWQLLQDFINFGEVRKSSKLLVHEKLKIPTLSKYANLFDSWHSVDNGEYYIYGSTKLYKFEDWSLKCCSHDDMWNFIKDKDVVSCEDPKKTHWQHFMKLDAIKRSKHDQELRDWVDGIMIKKVEYDDLNLQYNNLPAAPIVDANSFMNFCKLVHEDIIYKDYEIENYIMIIRSRKDVECRK